MDSLPTTLKSDPVEFEHSYRNPHPLPQPWLSSTRPIWTAAVLLHNNSGADTIPPTGPCFGCGDCVTVCPMDVLRFGEEPRQTLVQIETTPAG
jgi:ferredoxin